MPTWQKCFIFTSPALRPLLKTRQTRIKSNVRRKLNHYYFWASKSSTPQFHNVSPGTPVCIYICNFLQDSHTLRRYDKVWRYIHSRLQVKRLNCLPNCFFFSSPTVLNFLARILCNFVLILKVIFNYTIVILYICICPLDDITGDEEAYIVQNAITRGTFSSRVLHYFPSSYIHLETWTKIYWVECTPYLAHSFSLGNQACNDKCSRHCC